MIIIYTLVFLRRKKEGRKEGRKEESKLNSLQNVVMMRIRSKLELHTYSWWWLNSQSIFKPSPLTLLQTGPWESRLEATSLPKSFLGRHKDKSLYSILQSSM
jgi:hypothetical protein